MIYEKDSNEVVVHDKFVYCVSLYKIWSNGASLLDEKYYASEKPLKLSKNKLFSKRKNYILQRFLELQYAPESFLIKNQFKLKKNA